MYSQEELSVYPFFRELLTTLPLAALHDSLTGLIVRPFMLRFIQSLIQEQRPFTMAIVDLDNFKRVNDNYGHRSGDEMLSTVAESLRCAVGKAGLVGRYGGDEFLLVLPDNNDYDRTHAFLRGLYNEGGIFRRSLQIRGHRIFCTATIGSAACPKDADSFEALFSLADKTLYRGKSKGRNCFIIYVAEKHAQLEIPTLARRSLYDCFRAMADGFDRGDDNMDRLHLAFLSMRDNLRMHRLFYIDPAYDLYDVQSAAVAAHVEAPDALIRDGFYSACGLDEMARCGPTLTRHLRELGFESVLLCEVSLAARRYGLLVFCPEVHNLHLWQEHEYAAAFFLARLLAQQLAAEEARG